MSSGRVKNKKVGILRRRKCAMMRKVAYLDTTGKSSALSFSEYTAGVFMTRKTYLGGRKHIYSK